MKHIVHIDAGLDFQLNSKDSDAIEKQVIKVPTIDAGLRIYSNDIEEFIDAMIAMSEAMYPIPPPVGVGD